MTVAGSPPRVELYLRSLAPTVGREGQERVVERLRALDDADEIAGVEVTLSGECICPRSATAETDPGRQLLDRYDAFERWADERDRELVGFTERDTQSRVTGTTVTGIVFPRVVLAEFRNGALAFVAPSTDEDERTSVADRLDAY